MGTFKDLLVYQKAFDVAMRVFVLSKRFPAEEKYSLTDQCRRSSRSVTAQFAEAFRRRKYPAHFVSKLTDSDAENAETQVWLDYAVACGYLSKQEVEETVMLSLEVGNLLGAMIANPGKWCRP